MKNITLTGVLHKIWRWVRIPLAVLLVAYVGLVIYRIPAVGEQQRTAKAVADIQSQKINFVDVSGTVLPPMPNMEKNNATLAGVDTNGNGIRDDVEVAIFKLHPDSARIRAAELQYALALQNELNGNVFNSETLIAVIQQEARGSGCIADTAPALSPTTTPEFDKKIYAMIDVRNKEVESLVFNTDTRKQQRIENEKYMSSYKLENGEYCDVILKSLPN